MNFKKNTGTYMKTGLSITGLPYLTLQDQQALQAYSVLQAYVSYTHQVLR